MGQKSGTRKSHGEKVVKDIRRATRKQYSAEEKIRIVADGLKGEDSIADPCRREGIAQSLYCSWSREFPEAGKKRLAGDTARAASTSEVKGPRREADDLKEVVAGQALERRLLKEGMPGDGGEDAWGIPHPRSWGSSGWLRDHLCRPGEPWTGRASPGPHSIAGMIGICLAAPGLRRIVAPNPHGSGTVFPSPCARRSRTWP